MHIRPEPPRITPEAVIEALENPHDRRILALAQSRVVDSLEMIDATGVPRSTAYRRIERLRELNLLRIEGGAIKDGHAIERFSAAIEMASLVVEKGEVNAHWRVVETRDERLHRLWTQLR